MRLFDFGTPKKDFPLHSALKHSAFLGAYKTCHRYPMVVAGNRFVQIPRSPARRAHHLASSVRKLALRLPWILCGRPSPTGLLKVLLRASEQSIGYPVNYMVAV